jgi:sterol desaturase/sphingolipid hydroxylase (fatty acid hydroxylase superfamily)
MAAYSLRHSHIWLKWPGVWSKILGSPAHHQVHHSRHPDHLDKNFAFMLPVWDILFKTYEMPEDNRDVEFGIVEDSSDLNSCMSLYTIPFRDAYRVWKQGRKAQPSHSSETNPLVDAAE